MEKMQHQNSIDILVEVKLLELLGNTKALLPIWRRKSETSREMDYAEIIYGDIVLRSINNVQSAAKLYII